jgi:NAD(P)H-flavin reductase
MGGIGEAPLTIASSPTFTNGFEVVVRKCGNVSGAIHNLKAGDKLGVRGPMGRGIYPVDAAKGKDIVFICGGLGLVPQRSFINWVMDNRSDYGKVVILQGARDMESRLYPDELVTWSRQKDTVVLETLDKKDPRWQGNVGVVTTLISKVEVDLTKAVISVCGPPIMYKFVLMALEDYNVRHDNVYLNLERKMKCGVGKCGHCQINDLYCCMDGPVLKYSDLATLPEAI